MDVVTTDPDFLPDEGDFFKVNEVTYTLGHRYKENGVQYLYHDDVLKLFCKLLDNAKFRRVFSDKYPLILRDKEDPFLLFFMDTVEPIYHALETLNMQLLFDTLGIKRYPITKKSEKEKWKIFQEKLREAREKRAIDVIEVINETKLIPFPPKLDGWYHLYHNASGTIYSSNASIQAFLELDYTQFISAIEFLYPEALFSTEHGVKGEEYDNVIFVISKGWNMYQFETYAPMITGKASIPSGKQISFERNRNLFYICCSRPRKRLFFFVTVPIDRTFKEFLMELVGEENYYTYSQYIKKNIE